MVISEIHAILDLLLKVKSAVSTIADNFQEASDGINGFPDKVKLFETKAAQWEQLLKKHPLETDHCFIKNLEKAMNALIEAKTDFQAQQQSNRFLRWWTRMWFPKRWTARMRDVGDAFDQLLHELEEKNRMELAFAKEADKRRIPFSFSPDEKVVPIKKTVEIIREALEKDGSENNGVLLYGASGAGKSTLAKYLALDYFKNSRGIASSSHVSKFSDGVVFFSCGETTDSLSLLTNVWMDLGYNLQNLQGQGYEAAGSDRSTKVENLRRMLMTKLENGKSVLIIIDNVFQQDLISDVVLKVEGIKYVITSQHKNIWLEGLQIVEMEKPNNEEARLILANHIRDLDSKTFPTNVQGEVDGLIRDVDYSPLVLANLAITMKSGKVSDLGTWTLLRTEFKNAVHQADKSNTISRPTVYGKAYHTNLITSLTKAIDFISEEARSLVFLLAICTGDGVDENVLKFWFNTLYGKNEIMYNYAYEDLLDRSLMMLRKPIGGVSCHLQTFPEESLKLCSIHDLRREFVREMKEKEIAKILQQLTGGERATMGGAEDVSSLRSEENLAAALLLVYGDATYRKNVQDKIQIHGYFVAVHGTSEDKVRRSLECMKEFARMVQPAPDEAEACSWRKKTHEVAKVVILRFLQSFEFKEEELRTLLAIPEAFALTISALKLCSREHNLFKFLELNLSPCFCTIYLHVREIEKIENRLFGKALATMVLSMHERNREHVI